jgi:hypothetical protein
MSTIEAVAENRSRRKRWRSIAVHLLGLGCLFESVLVSNMVFLSISMRGYFYAFERSPLILACETVLSLFGFIYLLHLWLSFINGFRRV